MEYVIGIDASTTATKAILVGNDGHVAAVGVSEYGYETPHPLWSEQAAELWWDGAVAAIRACLARADVPGGAVKALGVTGQMHGLVLLDSSGTPVRPAILWNDQRTAAECDQIRDAIGKDRLIALTGNDALTGFTASKLLWVRNHEPEAFAAAVVMLLPKDYVRYRLTDVFATDKAGGSGTQLFDLANRGWSLELLGALGIDPGLLPEPFEGPDVTGVLSAAAALATGLQAGTPVVAGAGDQAANAVGTGAIEEGQMTLSLGTSGVVFAPTASARVEREGRVHAFCHALPDRWHMMGVMLSAAGSMRWLRDTIAPGMPFERLSAEAATVDPGSDGLLFLPYLTGERTPHPDPLARGAFVGLTVRHERAHLVRAVMEGVAFGLRDGYELMLGAGVAGASEIRASGGGIKSRLWRQITSDVLQAELVTVATEEGAAYGAAALAAVGAGWRPTVPDLVGGWVTRRDSTVPSGADYTRQYALYEELYPALRSVFVGLSRS